MVTPSLFSVDRTYLVLDCFDVQSICATVCHRGELAAALRTMRTRPTVSGVIHAQSPLETFMRTSQNHQSCRLIIHLALR